MRAVYSLIFVLLFLSYGYCQNRTVEIIADEDSLKVIPSASINELKQILFSSSLNDPFVNHITEETNKIFSQTYIPESGLNKLPETNAESFNLAKENMLGAIRMQPKFLPANELGMWGELFIYANAAAFGYALYQHIKKYKDEY